MIKKDEMIIEKCKTREGYKVKLPSHVLLDLTKIIPPTYEIICKTPIVSLFRYKEIEIAAHRYGELHFRYESDTKKIKEVATDIYKELVMTYPKQHHKAFEA